MTTIDARFWAEMRRRIRRLKLARRVVRLLFGPELTVVEKSEADNLFGYVTLWNDVQPVIDAARALFPTNTVDGKRYRVRAIVVDNADRLADALDRYETAYPEHSVYLTTPSAARPLTAEEGA